jgi:hypothetical protein
MQSFREPQVSSPPSLVARSPQWQSVGIGLATLPVLTLLSMGRVAAQSLTAIGRASEEVFRGDRLPTRALLDSDVPTQDASD